MFCFVSLAPFFTSFFPSLFSQVERGFAVSTSDKFIACACSNGTVKLFTLENLEYAETLHYSKATSFNGKSDASFTTKARGLDSHVASTLPDAIACQFSTLEKLGEYVVIEVFIIMGLCCFMKF